MYDIEKIVNQAGGPEYIKFLVEEQGHTQQQVQDVLGIKTTSRVTYKKFIDYCKITIPFPKVSNQESRKWMIRWSKSGTSYWNDEYLVEKTLEKLESPILNTAGKSQRYHISMWGHPSSNKDSHQVKAHQIVWELSNECFLPEHHEIEAVDGNFLNLDIANLRIRLESERKSFYSSGDKNYFYTGTPRYVNYTRGWARISKEYRNNISKCEICGCTNNLNVHHIISYWLFDDNDTRVHSKDNLLCACDSCHGKIHQLNTYIVPHISEMKYKNLLELLESLKSQVPESLIEIYKDVEKQLGLTGNQQPST
jgi:hypothetical protein